MQVLSPIWAGGLAHAIGDVVSIARGDAEALAFMGKVAILPGVEA